MNLNLDLRRAEEGVELMERGSELPTPSTPGFHKINIEEIEEVFKKRNFRRGFSMFDDNKDGRIDLKELKGMIRKFGNNVPPDVTKKIFKMCDEDNDGYLNYQDFMKMVNHPELKVLFQRYVHTYVNTIVPKRNALEDTDETDGLYEEEYSCWPPPVYMLLISIVMIVFFSIDASYYGAVSGTGPLATIFMYNPQKRYEAWRFLTYMFVHIGYSHLAINLLVQILLGIPLEMVHKGWRVLVVYLAGVIAGSMGTSLTDPSVFLAGASGGVYSLIAAHIASVIMNWREMSFPLLQLIVFVVVTVFDFGTAIYNRYYLKLEERIGYEAHFAGAIAGLLVGIFALRNLRNNSCENRLWWICLVTFVTFIVFTVIWHIAYPGYYAM
ncbi:rhomboid-4 [Carabus blaptoides fortunei]